MGLLCKLGLHSWEDMGLTDRGRLLRCRRLSCSSGILGGRATRLVRLPREQVAQLMTDEAKKASGRQEKREPDPEFERMFKVWESETTNEPERDRRDQRQEAQGGYSCSACKRQVDHAAASRCPNCGSRKLKRSE